MLGLQAGRIDHALAFAYDHCRSGLFVPPASTSQVTQLEAVNLAFAASGMTSDEWNELDQSERTAKIEIALDELAEAGEGEEVKTEEVKAPAPAKKTTAKKK